MSYISSVLLEYCNLLRRTDNSDFAEKMKAKIRAQKAQLQIDSREILSNDNAVELPKDKDVLLKEEAKMQQ